MLCEEKFLKLVENCSFFLFILRKIAIFAFVITSRTQIIIVK